MAGGSGTGTSASPSGTGSSKKSNAVSQRVSVREVVLSCMIGASTVAAVMMVL